MIDIRKAKNAKTGLHDMCKYLNKKGISGTMVEVGTFAGISTSIFLDYFNIIFCIDPWDIVLDKDDLDKKYGMLAAERQFNEMVFKDNMDKIVKMKMTSEEAVKYFDDNRLDFVYVDGDHSEEGVYNDISIWLPKIKVGGYIGGHDYNNHLHPGVKRAVDRWLTVEKTFKDTSWVAKKN